MSAPPSPTPQLRLIRPRPLAIALAATLVVVGSYAAALMAPAMPAAPTPSRLANASLDPQAPPAGPTDALLARFDRAITAWNTNLAANPGDYISATNLGTTYVGRARLTGDLADYQRALTAAERAAAIEHGYLPALALRATVLFAIHDFSGSLAQARAIRIVDPANQQALATIGDASLELGDVDGARRAYAELQRGALSAPVLSRLGHLAFIDGRPDAAIDLVRQAVATTVSDPPSETTAFYSFQLGELRRATGDLRSAAGAYRQALDDLPTYVPAMAGLARVLEAESRRNEAVELLEAATARLPQPELVGALGDLYALSGDARAAEREYALVERIAAVAKATGSVYDRQLVLFAADHDLHLASAVARARAELAVRKDIYGHDALAWVLFKAGDLDEAAAEARVALALGTRDPRLAYHAGMIAAAQGRADDARALLQQALAGEAYLPPLQAPLLEAALAHLSAEPAP